jgi:hypothetical protein
MVEIGSVEFLFEKYHGKNPGLVHRAADYEHVRYSHGEGDRLKMNPVPPHQDGTGFLHMINDYDRRKVRESWIKKGCGLTISRPNHFLSG